MFESSGAAVFESWKMRWWCESVILTSGAGIGVTIAIVRSRRRSTTVRPFSEETRPRSSVSHGSRRSRRSASTTQRCSATHHTVGGGAAKAPAVSAPDDGSSVSTSTESCPACSPHAPR